MQQHCADTRCPQSFYYGEKPMLSNEEFDNLKEELLWEGSKVAVLRCALCCQENVAEGVSIKAGSVLACLPTSLFVTALGPALSCQSWRVLQSVPLCELRKFESACCALAVL